ncbi:hypothetical protein ACE6H2_019791 [Prunus campanulata]
MRVEPQPQPQPAQGGGVGDFLYGGLNLVKGAAVGLKNGTNKDKATEIKKGPISMQGDLSKTEKSQD